MNKNRFFAILTAIADTFPNATSWALVFILTVLENLPGGMRITRILGMVGFYILGMGAFALDFCGWFWRRRSASSDSYNPQSPKWNGFIFGGVSGLYLFICLNIWPYLLTRGLAAGDGEELIGFPLIFRSYGGFGGTVTWYRWELVGDVLTGIAAFFLTGYLSGIRKISLVRIMSGVLALLMGARLVELVYRCCIHDGDSTNFIQLLYLIAVMGLLIAISNPTRKLGPLIMIGLCVVTFLLLWPQTSSAWGLSLFSAEFFALLALAALCSVPSWLLSRLILWLQDSTKKKLASD